MSQHVTDSNGNISVKERIAYGFGDFSSNIMYSAMSAFLMFYYTDIVGVGAAAVGVIMLCSRLFDGISDLIMGIIIDRTNSKYGKARVWILRLVIPSCCSQCRQAGHRRQNCSIYSSVITLHLLYYLPESTFHMQH